MGLNPEEILERGWILSSELDHTLVVVAKLVTSHIAHPMSHPASSSSCLSSSSSLHQANHCSLIFCLLLLHTQQLLYDDHISVIICHSVVLMLLVENVMKLK